MQSRSRRQAREAALRTLYGVEVGRVSLQQALNDTLENTDLASDLRDYMQKVVLGIKEFRDSIDENLSKLIVEWDFERVAPIDRNILRIAAYELFHEPAIPPAVSINEAIEMAKKYSTAESGRFVNGVLGKLLAFSPKANWDPSTAPAEVESVESEAVADDVPVETVEAGSPEAEELSKIGMWRVRSEEKGA